MGQFIKCIERLTVLLCQYITVSMYHSVKVSMRLTWDLNTDTTLSVRQCITLCESVNETHMRPQHWHYICQSSVSVKQMGQCVNVSRDSQNYCVNVSICQCVKALVHLFDTDTRLTNVVSVLRSHVNLVDTLTQCDTCVKAVCKRL